MADREEFPPFAIQTAAEFEDFEKRGIAGVLVFEDGERVEVKKTADHAKEIRRIQQERGGQRGKV